MEEIANFLAFIIFYPIVFIGDYLGGGIGILLVGLLPIYMHIYVYRKGVFKNKVDAILFFFFSFLLSSFITTSMMLIYARAKSGF
ncbi:hypothetical protein [uncultured Gammaproteobacteria bacterium]|jgi:glucose-6-phosphate-specific signal transduction histidine kinase|uniref:hypothetical protein n=1 Tax=thiotrophic endosymbiont of Bathymodiolus puteoserpentis (Logatchev) TaxID=343240 RepID=UPI0010B69846|nr:hypothetical protein [thiotrophic endosymbiont of Bathymodiolus puteoserpentis (Logatchev)]CAC9485964.1 hypothetical protein [uncultured Gammaproteobacteria bacterium]CAC9570326.1 hypothetical protein [uncultured Gammaproteobacteria bacterium]CAC9588610.1 hypothetical protein [uncultured Gammaproteobacteria bacterium]CAC9637535.1 hypothetical protein [uncultured Gammaproteobacteria bacterium]CAC9637693.1 hypothetical protein [uncultured Gammaproteobacteria bacterium]